MQTAGFKNPNPKLQSFWDYREFFKTLMRRAGQPSSAENAEAYRAGSAITPLNERLIQYIWANQLLQTEGLKLQNGEPLRVMDPGRWNGSAGPDFRGAKLMIGSRILTGDVEIHVLASEWKAHRHESDLDYNNVILHAVHQSDDGGKSDRLHNGESIPRLEMEPYIFPDIETIRRSMSADDFSYARPEGLGKCYDLMVSSDAPLIMGFLDRAGDERLIAKVRRLEDQLAHARAEGEDQVFHQALLMSLGSGAVKSLYYLLAKRTPVREVLDYARELAPAERQMGIESLLIHVAGLIPANEEWAEAGDNAPLADSRAYAGRLAGYWEKFAPYWSDRRIAPTRRWYKAIRPVNFPCRRLSAVAAILSRSLAKDRPPIREIEERVMRAAALLREARPTKKLHPFLAELINWFEIESPGNFWSTHYSFTAKPAAQPMALLGSSTARSLVFNAVIPALALLAKEEGNEELAEASHKLYSIFPPLQENHITEFMSRRLFGDDRRAGDFINTERRRQALFQVFYSCCNSQERHCDSCYYLTD